MGDAPPPTQQQQQQQQPNSPAVGGQLGPKPALGQFRSQSLPRLPSNAVTDGALRPAGVNAAAAAAVGGAGNAAAAAAGAGAPLPAAAAVTNSTRFVRTTKAVRDCLAAVKALSQNANSASSFREKCSNLVGAAIAANLALQESLGGHCNSSDREYSVQRYAADLQAKLLAADALVKKYGHETLWGWLFRFESKASVAAKFDALAGELHGLTEEVWDLIDPASHIKRDVGEASEAGAPGSALLTSGNAFSRHTLRDGNKRKVAALLALPDPEDASNPEGLVLWAADRHIQVTLPGSKYESCIEGAGQQLTAMAQQPSAPYVWAGYRSGSVAVWSLSEAAAASEPLRVADGAITALAVDPGTGWCWAGTSDGVVVVLRMRQTGSKPVAQLEHHKTLLGFDTLPPSASRLGSRSGSGSPSRTSSSPAPSTRRGGGNAAGAADAANINSSSSSGGMQPLQQQQRGAAPSCAGGGGSSTTGSNVRSRRRGRAGPPGAATTPPNINSRSTSAAAGGAGRQARSPPSSASRRQRSSSHHHHHHHYAASSQQSSQLCEADSFELTDCLGGSSYGGGASSTTGGGRSRRFKDMAVHGGPVAAIVVSAGRVYTAGGSSAGSSSLLIWDAESCELLRAISRSSSSHYRVPTTAMTVVQWASTRRAASLAPNSSMQPAGSSDALSSGSATSCSQQQQQQQQQQVTHLVTGHSDGSLFVWDMGADALRPVLTVAPDRTAKQAVRAVLVLDDLGVLACGHANGRSARARLVFMRKIDRSLPLLPRLEDSAIPRWNPTSFSLQAHRLGLTRMAGQGHLLVTSGKTGSIKLWPETTLRCLAAEAGVHLPFSRGTNNPVTEAVNSLLFRQQQQQPTTLREPSSSSGLLPPVTPQQQRAAGAAAAAAAGAGAAAAAMRQQQQHQQQQQPGQQQQQAEGAGGGGDGWPAGLRSNNNWVIPWAALNVDGSRKAIGRGSYGRVEVGCFNQTDVAVKILTDGGGDSSPEASSATWDRLSLDKLLHEVGILSTLRHPNVVLFMGVCLSPPAVVTELCPLRSLYDVLRKAHSDAAMAARLTWQRRLRMALDAAKGMLHLHSHKPTILHRDLKSPNLMVMQNFMVKVGDFNLSRYMALGDHGDAASAIQSSLELNPRWSAPEVISRGIYSTAGDVFSFGVVLFELLTWQEPWEAEGLSSYQIMTAVAQEGQRPGLPPLEQLPGQVGPPAAASGYIALMDACWSQEPQRRPTFEAVVARLKELLLITGPVSSPGTAAAAAAGAGAPAWQQQQHGGAELQQQQRPRPAAAAAGPETADLLQLGPDGAAAGDGLPGPSAPRPPAAALPPIPGTCDDGGGGPMRQPAAAAAHLPPKPPARGPSSGGGGAAVVGGGAWPSPFAAASGGGQQHVIGDAVQQQQQRQQHGVAAGPPAALAPLHARPDAGRPSSGGGGGAAAGGLGGRSPLGGGIRPSPFASSAAAAALVGEAGSSSGGGSDAGAAAGGGSVTSPVAGRSSSSGGGGATGSALQAAALELRARLDASLDAVSAVDPSSRRPSRPSSGGSGPATPSAAAANGRNTQGGGVAVGVAAAAAAAAAGSAPTAGGDLISLDSAEHKG